MSHDDTETTDVELHRFVEFIGPRVIEGRIYFCFKTKEDGVVGVEFEQAPFEQFAYILSDV